MCRMPPPESLAELSPQSTSPHSSPLSPPLSLPLPHNLYLHVVHHVHQGRHNDAAGRMHIGVVKREATALDAAGEGHPPGPGPPHRSKKLKHSSRELEVAVKGVVGGTRAQSEGGVQKTRSPGARVSARQPRFSTHCVRKTSGADML